VREDEDSLRIIDVYRNGIILGKSFLAIFSPVKSVSPSQISSGSGIIQTFPFSSYFKHRMATPFPMSAPVILSTSSIGVYHSFGMKGLS